MKSIKKYSYGFTIIELMITVAVIGILALIAIPNFLGFQERAKRKAIIEVASSSRAEIHHWMQTVDRKEKGLADFNADGRIDPLEAHTNLLIVPNSWIQSFAAQHGETPLSPWYGTKYLFTVEPFSIPHSGQIVFSTRRGGRELEIRAYEKMGNAIFQEVLSID